MHQVLDTARRRLALAEQMSSRQVKRLLQQQTPQSLADVQAEDDEDSPHAKTPFNPFDLLSDEDNTATAQEGEEEEQQTEPAAQPGAPAAKSVKTAPAKAKKKGKSKAKTKKSEQVSEEVNHTQMSVASPSDDIDKLVAELNLTTVGASPTAEPPPCSPAAELLGVDPRALRGDDELRRIFGSSVVQAVNREELAEAAQRRRQAAAMRGRAGAGAGRRSLKKGLLVTPKDHWPVLEPGLGMELLGEQEGVRQFTFTWSSSYRMHQATFERCQASMDPNAIAGLLHQAPYHVDSLLAMYDLYRNMGENQYAEDTLARALYACEMAWHPLFDIRSANCRLDFEVEENRGMFMALFKHIQALSRASCHRTALELVKLLLAMQPDDPLGALCLVDNLAIRAGRFRFLADFVAGFDADLALALRPNFAYALPMAALRQQQQQQQQEGEGEVQGEVEQPGASSTGEAAAGSKRDEGSLPPEQMLAQAILLHPSVVNRLVAKLQDKGSAREEAWSRLLTRRLFKQPHDIGSASLQHLGAIYVERSALLWKAPDMLELLRTAATAAADAAEGGSHKSGTMEAVATGSQAPGSSSSQDWVCVRQEAFPDDQGRNEWLHLRLADFSDNVNALPREELQAAMGAGPGPGDPGAAGGLILAPPVRGQVRPPGQGPQGHRGGRHGQLLQVPAGWEAGLPPGLCRAPIRSKRAPSRQQRPCLQQGQGQEPGLRLRGCSCLRGLPL
ncbi:transcriptional repressor TCF25-domain-containing protein [Haematococcus lacustris]